VLSNVWYSLILIVAKLQIDGGLFRQLALRGRYTLYSVCTFYSDILKYLNHLIFFVIPLAFVAIIPQRIFTMPFAQIFWTNRLERLAVQQMFCTDI
jgi:hypothetical protein